MGTGMALVEASPLEQVWRWVELATQELAWHQAKPATHEQKGLKATDHQEVALGYS